MKKLKKLNKTELKSFKGGIGDIIIATSKSFKTDDGCTHDISDYFKDRDHDGVRDWGEDYHESEIVECL